MREESEPVYVEEVNVQEEVKEKVKVVTNEEGDNDRIKEEVKEGVKMVDVKKVDGEDRKGKSEPGVQDPAYWENKGGKQRSGSGAQPMQMKGIDIADSPLG